MKACPKKPFLSAFRCRPAIVLVGGAARGISLSGYPTKATLD